MLNVRVDRVPDDVDEVNIDGAELGRQIIEVDRLRRRPDAPVDQIDGRKFGAELLQALAHCVPLQSAHSRNESEGEKRRSDSLIPKNLAQHRRSIRRFVKMIEHLVERVHHRTED